MATAGIVGALVVCAGVREVGDDLDGEVEDYGLDGAAEVASATREYLSFAVGTLGGSDVGSLLSGLGEIRLLVRDATVDLLPLGTKERLILEVLLEEKNSFIGDDFWNCGLEILAKLEVEDGDFIAELLEFHKKILSVQKIVVLLQSEIRKASVGCSPTFSFVDFFLF